MHYAYMDESKSADRTVFAALAIPTDRWREAKEHMLGFRHELRDTEGIFIRKEFHATDFVKGKGRLGVIEVPRYRRAEIFDDTLRMIATLPGARLMIAVCKYKLEDTALQRLLTRVNNAAEWNWRTEVSIFCDEGNEEHFVRLQRRLGTYNPVPSQYGRWDNGQAWKNNPNHRIIEDPVFKDSKHSYFIQAADYCAFAFLRHEQPTPYIIQYGLDDSFNLLNDILHKEASKYDPRGIIRVNAPALHPTDSSTRTGTRRYTPAPSVDYAEPYVALARTGTSG